MHRSDRARGTVGHCFETLYRITFDHFETATPAHVDEHAIDLETFSDHSAIAKNLQPFSPPATDIDHWRAGSAGACLPYQVEIRFDTSTYDIAISSKAVFESGVERIECPGCCGCLLFLYQQTLKVSGDRFKSPFEIRAGLVIRIQLRMNQGA
jgi:hypothetical protein